MWPKHRILEVYANIAEFGDGVYGAQAAARTYFRKDASRLTPAEAARMAAVLPSPRRYSVGQARALRAAARAGDPAADALHRRHRPTCSALD